ncbi:hypothetical protein JKP88DRAFT_348720 [Tribonema minus]|uniref:Aspartyl/asparaginy/proline hydroxylase domain-containing protein n=1 Tax=Tribonema minus TaxID=303371 RepID=A0A836CEF1_9STRA|nr:hypothetical protein JKP88DRAFT_348720 [Tribonema minus]
MVFTRSLLVAAVLAALAACVTAFVAPTARVGHTARSAVRPLQAEQGNGFMDFASKLYHEVMPWGDVDKGFTPEFQKRDKMVLKYMAKTGITKEAAEKEVDEFLADKATVSGNSTTVATGRVNKDLANMEMSTFSCTEDTTWEAFSHLELNIGILRPALDAAPSMDGQFVMTSGALPVEDGSLDCLIYWDQDEFYAAQTAAELVRVLRRGGVLLVVEVEEAHSGAQAEFIGSGVFEESCYMVVQLGALAALQHTLAYPHEDIPAQALGAGGGYGGCDCAVYALTVTAAHEAQRGHHHGAAEHKQQRSGSGRSSREGSGTGAESGPEEGSGGSGADRAEEGGRELQTCSGQCCRGVRGVAPPFLDWRDVYPELGILLEPQNLSDIMEEMRSVRSAWKAWPETHYSEGGSEDWKVVPFAHCFPACDASKLTWVPHTCAHCPRTVALLRQLPTLRTALFSRLGGGTKISSHRGWSDLANDVLRCHLALVVPPDDPHSRALKGGGGGGSSGSLGGGGGGGGSARAAEESDGCCGIWVEGQRRAHRQGEIMVFDDSKLHKAYNHSYHERVVLIVDLLRPPHVPRGTARRGMTAELEGFIAAFAAAGIACCYSGITTLIDRTRPLL